MRLKRIDLHGFKSFSDRATLHFEHPIVGIVGPNGCGKSNILDAIRWVMGEQSIKSLRGKDRTDIIFNGSEKRKRASTAEVTLVLGDVPEDKRPEGFEEKSEIAVTRRLSTNGKSEYFINRLPCRLREIRMLFMGTGLGKHSYALIEQGRVNEFIQATPLKRRLLFEEAAGISRYKEHRKQAESRMAQTQTNLDRLGDVMKELNSRRNSLQRQASKAKRHRVLKGEIKELDLYLSSHRYLEAWAKQRQIQLVLNQSTEELNGLRTQLQGQEDKASNLQDQRKNEALQIQEKREELQDKVSRIALLEQTYIHLQEDLTSLHKRREQLKKELDRITWQKAQDQETLEQLGEERQKMEQEAGHSVGDLTKLNKNLERTNQEIEEAEDSLDALKAEVIDVATQQATIRNQSQELTRRKQELSGRFSRNKHEEVELKKQIESLEDILKSTTKLLERCIHERDFLLDQQAQDQEDLSLLNVKIRASETEFQQQQNKLAERQARLDSLEEIQSQYQDLNEASRALLQAVETDAALENFQIEGVVAESIEPAEEYETAVAAALGDKLHYLLLNSPRDAVRAISYLHQKKLGRTGFLVSPKNKAPKLALPPKHKGVIGWLAYLIPALNGKDLLIEQLLRPYLLVDTIDTAMELLTKVESDTIIVCLDGSTLSPNGEFNGGQDNGSALGFLQRRRQIKELHVEIETRLEKLDLKKIELAGLRDNHQRLTERLEKQREQIQQLSLKRTALEKDKHKLEEDRARQQERANLLSSEQKRITDQENSIVQEQKLIERRIIQLEQRREEQENKLESTRMKIDQERKRQVTLTQELTSLKVEMAARQERQEALNQQWQQLQSRQKNMLRRHEELQMESDLLSGNLDKKKESCEEAQKEAKQLKVEVVTDQKSLKKRLKGHENSESKLNKLNKTIENNRKAIDRTTENRTAQLLEQRELEVHQKSLDQEIQERYGIPIGEALPGNHCKPLPTPADYHELNNKRKQLQKLGEVNALAEKEFEEIDERFLFLKDQISDLEKTLASLKRSIQKINQQSRQTFQKTFEAIRSNFTTLFPKLFEGGDADLVLTDPDNLLETGVDILVRPPGKRRQNIILLSGGEKAMTTVALIFSFFLYKPSPFCVLDEVDAPLDDANNDRFNRLLSELSDLSQFIVITHNKRTMEKAHQLYGITMQDPGVSTVVSVRLEEDAQAA